MFQNTMPFQNLPVKDERSWNDTASASENPALRVEKRQKRLSPGRRQAFALITGLLAQTQLGDQGQVAVGVLGLQVVQQLATAALGFPCSVQRRR